MAALFTAPGPIDLYARFAGETTALFLGHCRESPEVDWQNVYLECRYDGRSRTLPAAKIFDGSRAVITGFLERVDPVVLKRCLNPVDHSANAASVGIDGRLELGNFEPGFEFIARNSFFGTNAATADLAACKRFFWATIPDYKEVTSGGNTRIIGYAVRIECDAIRDPATGNWALFSESASGVTFGPLS